MESIPHMKPPWDDGSGPDYSSPYQDLATAIVLLAVRDYKKTLRAIWKTPKSEYKRRKLIAQKAELEEFFYSDAYRIYWQQVPQVSIAQTYLKIMNKFAEQFGLTPSSRSRIIASSESGGNAVDEMEELLGGGS